MTHLTHIPQEASQGSHADTGYEPQYNVLHRNSTGVIFQDNITCTPHVPHTLPKEQLKSPSSGIHTLVGGAQPVTQGLETHKVANPMHAIADPEALTLQACIQ